MGVQWRSHGVGLFARHGYVCIFLHKVLNMANNDKGHRVTVVLPDFLCNFIIERFGSVSRDAVEYFICKGIMADREQMRSEGNSLDIIQEIIAQKSIAQKDPEVLLTKEQRQEIINTTLAIVVGMAAAEVIADKVNIAPKSTKKKRKAK